MNKKPTIAELEAMLDKQGTFKIEILPNGEIRSVDLEEELKKHKEAVDHYRFSFKATQAQCGIPDPAEACREILRGATEALEKGSAILEDKHD